MISKKEQERLQLIYRLFTFEFGERTRVHITDNHSISNISTTARGSLTHEITKELDKLHGEKSMAHDLMEQHPNLHISVSLERSGVLCSVWVQRDGRDTESIGNFMLALPDAIEKLRKWSMMATVAVKEGNFFCTGHTQAETKGEGNWFYFAGRYCKEYGEEHPDKLEAAKRETYN